MPRLKQVCQRKQHDELSRLLLQAAVAGLQEAKLPLDDAERILDLRTDAGLGVLDRIQKPIESRVQQCLALSLIKTRKQNAWLNSSPGTNR